MTNEFIVLDYYRKSELPQFERHYHVKINDDGGVWDCIEKMKYGTLLEWAKYTKNYRVAN